MYKYSIFAIKIYVYHLIVCPEIFMQHIWTTFNKNTNTFESSAMAFNERKNIHSHIIIFQLEKFTGTKTNF